MTHLPILKLAQKRKSNQATSTWIKSFIALGALICLIGCADMDTCEQTHSREVCAATFN